MVGQEDPKDGEGGGDNSPPLPSQVAHVEDVEHALTEAGATLTGDGEQKPEFSDEQRSQSEGGPAANLKKFLHGLKVTDWITAVATVVIAGATIWNVLVISGELDEMQSAGEDTKRLVTATQNLAKAAEAQAAATTRAIIGVERPIIFVSVPSVILVPPRNPREEGNYAVFRVDLHNVGKQPAIISVVWAEFILQSTNRPPDPVFPSKIGPSDCPFLFIGQVPLMVGQEGVSFVCQRQRRLTDAELMKLSSGELLGFLRVNVFYSDALNSNRLSNFVLLYVPTHAASVQPKFISVVSAEGLGNSVPIIKPMLPLVENELRILRHRFGMLPDSISGNAYADLSKAGVRLTPRTGDDTEHQ